MNDHGSATAGAEMRDFERSLDHLDHNLDRLADLAGVDQVFGEPVRHGDTTIIPAAEVLAAMGFGFGVGRGSDALNAPNQGGGGSVMARPVAVVVASPGQGVRVTPVIDLTKVALAALTAGGFMLATWLRVARPKKPR